MSAAPVSILVATDFSPGAHRTLERSAWLPLADGARIELVHVLPPDLGPEDGEALRARAAESLTEDARFLESLHADRDGSWRVETAVIAGKASRSLVERAVATGAGLIVTGRRSRRRLREVLLGSTAERVVRRSRVPVLVVGPEPLGPYRRLVVGTDFGPASRRALELALALAAPELESAELIHGFELPAGAALYCAGFEERVAEDRARLAHEAAARLERFAGGREALAGWRRVARPGDPRYALLDAAEDARADLLAVGAHGESGLAEALLGSVSEAVVRGAGCDVLVVPAD